MTGLLGAPLLHQCSGDASQANTCTISLLGIELGTMRFAGVTFPMAPGPVHVAMQSELKLPDGLPDFAKTTTAALTVTAADGSSLICVRIHIEAV